MTGGEVPEGADTVVKQEIVKADDKEITFPSEVRAGDNVRRKGEEIRSGDVCMTKGTLLHAPEINFLAALGIHKVTGFQKGLGGVFSPPATNFKASISRSLGEKFTIRTVTVSERC
mgnify:CR=1 FL=1